MYPLEDLREFFADHRWLVGLDKQWHLLDPCGYDALQSRLLVVYEGDHLPRDLTGNQRAIPRWRVERIRGFIDGYKRALGKA